MGDAGYRGVSADQDGRFRNKETKLLKQLEANKAFPSNFNQKVDLRKVNMEVMRRWIEDKVTELLGFEDDVVAEYVCGILESEEMQPHPDPRKLQLSLTGFLESSTPTFTAQLWTLLLSAQDSIGGIPREFVEQKKEEMRLARQRDGEGIQRSAIATASAIASSLGSQQQGGGSGSAKRGLPSRPPAANFPQRPAQRSAFQDKRGNQTERVSDAGWGARRGGGGAEGDSYRPAYRRSPSPRRQYDDDGDRYPQRRRDDRYAPPRRRDEDDDDEGRYRQRRRVASPDRRDRDYAPAASSSRPRRYTRSPSPDRRRSRSPPRRSRRRSSSRRSYSGSYSPETTSRQKQRRGPSRSISRSRSPVARRSSVASRSYRSRSDSSRSRSKSPVRREGRGREVSRSISRSRSRSFSRSRSSGSSRSRSRSTRSRSPVGDRR